MLHGKVYAQLASLVQARLNCLQNNNKEWEDKHSDSIAEIMTSAPSGSGIDCGTKLDFDKSNGNKLVFTFSYHHMNDAGMYDGWTEHTLTVKPHLSFGFDTTISGRDRNQVKEYLYELYHYWLGQDIAEAVPNQTVS